MTTMKIESIHDIEQIEKEHELDELIEFDNTYAAIRSSAQKRPARTAISFFLTGDDHQNAVNVSYAELLQKITQTANMLHRLGLKQDDVVAYIMPNLPETHYIIWGGEAKCQILAINPLLEPAQIKELLNSAKAKVLVTMNPAPKMELWEKVATILPAIESVRFVIGVDIAHYVAGFSGLVAGFLQGVKKRRICLPDNMRYLNFATGIKRENGAELDFNRRYTNETISSLFCTGGTTGLPKIAMRSHRNELVNAVSVLYASAGMLEEGKTILCGLPLLFSS